ncbi:accessory gene regulator B family protein [Oscillospiraceae bacterium OttesenSCG-928-G22]|nr:accessory gene regulator B family protein [Oscillospiraceae bacterium OttesenSCG-928-G22]
MEKLAAKIGAFLVKNNAAKAEDQEVLSFGLFLLLADAQQLVILMLLALLFDVIPAMTAYILFYTLLRRYAGGAHANTHRMCLFVFTLLASAVSILGSRYLSFMPRIIPVALSCVTAGTIFLKAPAAHPNNPKRPKTLARYRRISRAMALAELAVILTGSLLLSAKWDIPILCAALGGLIASLTLLPPISKKEVSRDEEDHG